MTKPSTPLSTPVLGYQRIGSAVAFVLFTSVAAAGFFLLPHVAGGDWVVLGRIAVTGVGGLLAVVCLWSALAGDPHGNCPLCAKVISGNRPICYACSVAFRRQHDMYVELPEDDVGTVFEIVFPNHDYVLPALCINCGQPSMQMKDVRAISGTQSNLGSTTTRYNVIKVPVCEKGHVSEHFTMKGVGYSPLGKDADGYGGVPAYYSIQTSSYRVFKEFVRLNPKYAQLSGTKWM